jgi:hypothetical protein
MLNIQFTDQQANPEFARVKWTSLKKLCYMSTTIVQLPFFWQVPLQRLINTDNHWVQRRSLFFFQMFINWYQVSIVSQEPTLFNCTIEENIAYGLEGKANFADVESAAVSICIQKH